MPKDFTAQTELDVCGAFFELEELEALVGLSTPAVRIDIVTTAPSYEEIAVIRDRAAALILGTLHKTPDGILILTREDRSRLLSAGTREAYLTMRDAIAAVTRLAGQNRTP